MHLEIVSPEATLFSGEVESVIVPGTTGSFQMLNNHAPIVSTLKEGTVTISGKMELDHVVQNKFKKQDDNTTLFEITSGAVEMRNNKLILLAD
ncbi:F0F1 ATP synthase subunit epsilon [Flavobacteriaceae bacterium]|jgi:F-type H+-transporting ATPase subunit epsilon|nr:F0F1 ATP synthase subunit epsilon [Flavobacteriaceae bacterium]